MKGWLLLGVVIFLYAVTVSHVHETNDALSRRLDVIERELDMANGTICKYYDGHDCHSRLLFIFERFQKEFRWRLGKSPFPFPSHVNESMEARLAEIEKRLGIVHERFIENTKYENYEKFW